MNTPNNMLTNETPNQESNKSTHDTEKSIQDTRNICVIQTLEIIDGDAQNMENSSPHGENLEQIPDIITLNMKQPARWSHEHAIKLIKEGAGRW